MSKNKPIKKIIWAYDPFEGVQETHSTVAKAIGFFNETSNASVQPVYVLSPADLNLQMSLAQPHIKQYLPSAEKTVAESLKDIQLEGLKKHEVVIQRLPYLRQAIKAILSFAQSKHADLIAVGTHARKGLSLYLLGSFTETLVLHSKIPVLVVNPTANLRPIRRILFPTDFEPHSKSLFKKVCSLARSLGAEVTLLHVIPHPIQPVLQAGVYLLGGGWVAVPDYMKSIEERLMKTASRWKQEAASGGVVVSVAFDSGSEGVKQAILEHAKSREADLIAMGAHSGPIAAAMIGSRVREVLREAPCPVWVVRK